MTGEGWRRVFIIFIMPATLSERANLIPGKYKQPYFLFIASACEIFKVVAVENEEKIAAVRRRVS